jgi:hypothetical protein
VMMIMIFPRMMDTKKAARVITGRLWSSELQRLSA